MTVCEPLQLFSTNDNGKEFLMLLRKSLSKITSVFNLDKTLGTQEFMRPVCILVQSVEGALTHSCNSSKHKYHIVKGG